MTQCHACGYSSEKASPQQWYLEAAMPHNGVGGGGSKPPSTPCPHCNKPVSVCPSCGTIITGDKPVKDSNKGGIGPYGIMPRIEKDVKKGAQAIAHGVSNVVHATERAMAKVPKVAAGAAVAAGVAVASLNPATG